MATSYQPVVTPDDFSSIPMIISWFLAVSSVLFVATKIVTKFSMTRTFAIDDAAILIALAFSIGMVVAVSIQGQNGLGKRESSLSESQLTAYEKSVYATEFLYITTLFFSKSSVLVLFRALTPFRTHQLLTYAAAGLLGLWAVSGIFTVAFQCSAPQRWAVVRGTCINQTSFWTSFGVLNIITEIFLVVIPAVIMRKVQIPQAKKTVIVIVFALRVFVIGAIVPELIFRARADRPSADRTFDAWPAVVCELAVQGLSIIFACVPYLKPFFGALESGMIRMDDTRRREGRTTRGGYYFKKADKAGSGGSGGSSGKQSSKGSAHSRLYPLQNWTHVSAGMRSASAAKGGLEDTDHESQRSDSRIIRATTTFEVREDV